MERQSAGQVGGDTEDYDSMGWNPLMRAVYTGDLQLTVELLNHGYDVCSATKHGVTAFTIAAAHGHTSLLKLLYERLTPELQNTESSLALEAACVFAREHAVRWLLGNTPAGVCSTSTLTGVSPLHLAKIGNHHHIVQLLLAHVADPQVVTSSGQVIDGLGKHLQDCKADTIPQKENISPCQNLFYDFKKDSTTIDPMFTSNDIIWDLNGDVVLKNSPCRPVFRVDIDQTNDKDITLLTSPSMNSVFLHSSEQCSTPKRIPLGALISPRYKPLASAFENIETPKSGRKRKLPKKSHCSSWLKRFTKKGRTKSLDDSDDGYENLNDSSQFGFDFLQLLFKLGLEEFYQAFKEQELDIWTFLTLTEEDLDAMAINDATSKTRILKAISALRRTQL